MSIHCADQDQLRTVTPGCNKKAKTEEKERKHRCDISHICPDHPHWVTTIKVVTWGRVADVVNHAKFRLDQFLVSASRGVKI